MGQIDLNDLVNVVKGEYYKAILKDNNSFEFEDVELYNQLQNIEKYIIEN